MTIVLSGKLPGGEPNGISAIAESLVGDPARPHVIVAVVKCRKITTEPGTLRSTATAGIEAIEAFAYGEDEFDSLRELMSRRREYRTGSTPLPFQDHE